MTRILHLTLTKKWFDLTASGKKKEEYREDKPYWNARLSSKNKIGFERFDEIHYTNGYGKDKPFCSVICDGILFYPGWCLHPENGELLEREKYYYTIKNGLILETRNWEP